MGHYESIVSNAWPVEAFKADLVAKLGALGTKGNLSPGNVRPTLCNRQHSFKEIGIDLQVTQFYDAIRCALM